jgi:hypothetical protein
MYKLLDKNIVLHIPSKLSIPFDSGNSDYQRYKEWLKKGNRPEPADPEPKPDYATLRERAYRKEADGLFFKEQRGDVPIGTWLRKVNDIKKRYPKKHKKTKGSQ